MTLRQLVVCASPLVGSHTVREHMTAMTCDFIGGSMTVNGEFYYLQEEKDIILNDIYDIITIEEPGVIEINDDAITIEEGDIVHGIQ